MAAVAGSSVSPLVAAGISLSHPRPPRRRSTSAVRRRRLALPSDGASHADHFSSDLPNTPAAADDERIQTPSSPSTVRFVDDPIHFASQDTPKLPLKRYSEPLRSAFASPSARHTSQSRPPRLLHTAVSRARELRQRATAVLNVYERIADSVFRGVFLDDAQNERSIQRALSLWNDLESYKTYNLFEQAPFNHHFIDSTEYTTGLSSGSSDALLFDEITQSIYIANCAIFIHYTWNLPYDPSRILANGTTWNYRSLAELKEAWRVFWRLIVPANPASVDVTTQHLLDCYLELSTQAFLAQHFALLERVSNGALASQQADAESIAHLHEVMSSDAVTDALGYGKIGFETQNQALTQGLPQSQISRHEMQQTWTLMVQHRVSAIETSGPDADRLRATFTPLAPSVMLTDLALLILKGERREASQSQGSPDQVTPIPSQVPDLLASGQEEREGYPSIRTHSVTPSSAYTPSVESGSTDSTMHSTESQAFSPSQRMAAFNELVRRQRSLSRLSSQDTTIAADRHDSSLSARPDDTSMASVTPSDSIEDGTYPQMDAYGPFESTPMPRVPRSIPPAGHEDSLGTESLSSDDYMSQRAEWLAELIAQEESMSDSEHTGVRSRSSSEVYTESALEDDSSRDTVMEDLTTQDRSDALESLLTREHETALGRSAYSTPVSRPETPTSSDSGTPILDSPTRQALALPSTPDRPFVEKARRQSSSMAGRTYEPPPVRHANLIASSDSEQDIVPPEAPRKVIKFRGGRLVREIDPGSGPDFLRSRGRGERIRKFSSQESSDSDIFLQRRAILKQALGSSPQQARAVQWASEQATAAETAIKPEQSTPTMPAFGTPGREVPPQIVTVPAVSSTRQRSRLPAYRQPRNFLLYVEIKTPRPIRRRWMPEEPPAPSNVAEMQESFSRMGVTTGASTDIARGDAFQDIPDIDLAHEDVPDSFIVDMGHRSDALAAADNGAQSEVDEAARKRVEELTRMKDHGAYEGDDDPELVADRKQLTLEYWFARERPGFEHLPDPKGTGRVAVPLQRSAHRDVVLGTVEEEEEEGGGMETPPLPNDGSEHRRRHRDAGTSQPGETEPVDAAAGPSDPEDEDFNPASTSRKRKSRGPVARDSRLGGQGNGSDNAGEDVAMNVETTGKSPRSTGRKRVKVEQTQSSRKGKGRTLESLGKAEERAQGRATANAWTAEETECFLSAMYQLARLKEENPQYRIYSEILSRHGKYGSESRILAARDNVSLKDKARWELWRMRRAGEQIPYWKKLYWSKVFDGRVPTWDRKEDGGGRRRKNRAASSYGRDVRMESQPHDGEGSATPRPRRGSVVRGSHDPISEVDNALTGAEIAENQSREADRNRLLSVESDDPSLTSAAETSRVKAEPMDALTRAEERRGPTTRRRAKLG